MSTEITTLASAINTEHRKAQESSQAAIDHAHEAGRLLVEAKATVAHGEGGAWLEANFQGSERTARGYMRLANNWEAIAAKRQTSADLSIDGALQLLSAPKDTPKPKPDWLPTDPDVLAILVFKHTVPGISIDDEPVERRYGTQAKLSTVIDKSPAQTSQWLNGSVGSKNREASRNESCDIQRHRNPRRERCWMDVDHSQSHVTTTRENDYRAPPASVIQNVTEGPGLHRPYPLISKVQAGVWTEFCDNFPSGVLMNGSTPRKTKVNQPRLA